MGKGLDSILLGQWWVASHTVTSPLPFHTLTQCLSHLALGLLGFFFPPLEPAIEGQNDNIYHCYHEAVMDVNLQPTGQVHLHLLPYLFVVCLVNPIIT